MRKMTQILAALAWLVATPVYSQETTETIITTGMGSTIESAIQNAARNALTQAVGQFVDTETQISKRTEIRDGVREITKDMSENISATSNGTIQEVMVLEQHNNDGIFQVEAAVTVRISDLERAMEGRLNLSSEVSNVFAQIASANDKNFNDRVEIFQGRFLNQVISTEFLEVSVGAPQSFQSYLSDHDVDKLEGGAGGYMSLLKHKFGNIVDDLTDLYARDGYTLLVLPVDIGYTDSAIQSWKATLTELASDSYSLPWGSIPPNRATYYSLQQRLSGWQTEVERRTTKVGDLPICFVKINSGVVCYTVSGFSAAALEENINPYFMYWALRKDVPRGSAPKVSPIRGHGLEISVIDQNGFPISVGEVIRTSAHPNFQQHLDNLSRTDMRYEFRFADFPAEAFPMTPYSTLLNAGRSQYPIPMLFVFEHKRIHVGLILTADQLAKARSINSAVLDGAVLGACDFNAALMKDLWQGNESAYLLCQ